MNVENMAGPNRTEISIEVVFALPDRQVLESLTVPVGSNCAAAIRACGISAQFPHFDLSSMPLAIWGRSVGPDELLKDGDRLEFLRPLQMDPRDARRQRAMAGLLMDGTVGDGKS